MTFEELKEVIRTLKTEEQIKEFVNLRIEELEKTSVDTTAGVEYTDTFDDYIGSKVHFKTAPSIGKEKLVLPDVVYDDYEPYYEIIKKLIEGNFEDDEYSIYASIAMVLRNYFFGEPDKKSALDRTIERATVYKDAFNNGISKISIKSFKKSNHVVCSEIAGLSHNIYKILGIPSQLVIGKRNGEPYAFNIIFRYGYNQFPAALVDYTDPIALSNPEKNTVTLFPLISGLAEETYNQLLEGEEVKINTDDLVELYRKVKTLENSILVSENLTYR
ncbi:MAG: hypothetical protein K2L98_02820, partial [Bacilli bacterium]|nr:hypothetical protein [Bacilli bacterium]